MRVVAFIKEARRQQRRKVQSFKTAEKMRVAANEMTKNAELKRKIAEVLYDELSGKRDGVPLMMREFEENAALASIVLPHPEKWQDRDEKLYELLKEADYLGYEVHRKTPDRWGLANRLAVKVLERLDEPS